MNPRSTLLLALVVAAVAAFVWFYEVRGAEERAEAEAAQDRLFPEVEPEEVASVTLHTPAGETARLERTEGAWRLAEPLATEADPLAADGVASALAELASEAVFEEPEPRANYGLPEEPTVRFQADGAEHALFVGDKTPVGGNTYVAKGGSEAVYAVATWRLNALRKSVKELRDARVLDFDREALSGLRLRWPGGGVSLSRDGEAGAWRVIDPIEAPADPDTVDALLSTLQFLRAEDFVDDPAPDAESRLEEPVFEAELLRGEEDEAPLRLVVAGTADGQTRLVRGRADDVLYRIAESRVADFPRTVAAYRQKDLAEFDVADAQVFELVLHGEDDALQVRGTRGDTGWTTEPEPMAAGRAARMVGELARLEAEDVAAESAGEDELEALGLRPPRAVIRVYGDAAEEGADAPVLADVRLGEADPARGVAAQRAGSDVVYWLDYALAEHLPLDAEAFRNRFRSEEGEGAADAGDVEVWAEGEDVVAPEGDTSGVDAEERPSLPPGS